MSGSEPTQQSLANTDSEQDVGESSANPTELPKIHYDHRKIIYNIISETLFVLLPFIVIGMTIGHRGQLHLLFTLPEWSIVSAVIVGQTIVRAVSVLLNREIPRKEGFVLFIAALLVLLLVPVLILLAIVLTSDTVSLSLEIVQTLFFALSLIAFAFGSAMQTIVETKDAQRRKHREALKKKQEVFPSPPCTKS